MENPIEIKSESDFDKIVQVTLFPKEKQGHYDIKMEFRYPEYSSELYVAAKKYRLPIFQETETLSLRDYPLERALSMFIFCEFISDKDQESRKFAVAIGKVAGMDENAVGNIFKDKYYRENHRRLGR